ncbi:MAG: response regulator transcription factor [Planctomycetes bacterium]|nr:response regulator transcription factor [Planctomycetota bacterium]
MKILVADDSLITRKILQRALENANFNVIIAEDGDDAWQKLTESPDISLAILDWMMPGLSGIDICKKLSKKPSGFVYVILLTAKDGHKNLDDAIRAGASDFIHKPFDNEELLARIRAGQRTINRKREQL